MTRQAKLIVAKLAIKKDNSSYYFALALFFCSSHARVLLPRVGDPMFASITE
jgi:hypothetical protein